MKESSTKDEKKTEKADIKRFISKYSKLDFEKLDRFFNVSEMNAEHMSLDALRHRITDKIDFFSKMLEELLQPEASLQCIYECKTFDEEARRTIFLLYRKLKKYSRESDMIELESSEKENIDFIARITGEWIAIKEKLKPLLKDLKESWESEDSSILSDIRYLG